MWWRRLKSELVRFRYPKHTYRTPPCLWAHRAQYFKPNVCNTNVVLVETYIDESKILKFCRKINTVASN